MGNFDLFDISTVNRVQRNRVPGSSKLSQESRSPLIHRKISDDKISGLEGTKVRRRVIAPPRDSPRLSFVVSLHFLNGRGARTARIRLPCAGLFVKTSSGPVIRPTSNNNSSGSARGDGRASRPAARKITR